MNFGNRLAISLLLAGTAKLWAAPASPQGASILPGNDALRVAVQLTVAALLPLAILAFTPFLRVSTVLYFLRQALGIPNVPSNQIILVLSLLLTYGIMKPTLNSLYSEAVDPYVKGAISESQALDLGQKHLRSRMTPYAGDSEIQLMLKIGQQAPPASREQLPFDTLAGAYVLSELKTAFRMGAMIYIPFLIVDLVVSALVVALGMIQLPPALVSTPLKILVFVLADGWVLLLEGLSNSFPAK
jgi:flagellar biosynthetic protein FliP